MLVAGYGRLFSVCVLSARHIVGRKMWMRVVAITHTQRAPPIHPISYRGKKRVCRLQLTPLYDFRRGGLTIKKTRGHCRVQLIIWKNPPNSHVCVCTGIGSKVSTQEGAQAPFCPLFIFSMNNKRILEITDSLTSPSKTCSPQKFNTHKHTHLAFMLG